MTKNITNKNLSIILILLFLLVFFLVLLINAYYAYKYPIKYKNEIIKYSTEYNLDSALVASVINAESRFNANAVSKKGAIGLMQILPSTAKFIANELNIIDFQKEDLYLPELNIKFGCFYLNYLSNKFSTSENILCAYNAGETVVFSWLKDETITKNGNLKHIPYVQTREYVEKVKQNYKYYSKKFWLFLFSIVD